MPDQSPWRIQPTYELPEWFVEQVSQSAAELTGHHAAQLLWQRGIRDRQQLAGFLHPDGYQPASPFEFGAEMQQAIARILQARQQSEKVAIWGDFDADGITATAVLWEGLGQFLPQPHLTYFIPNRLTASHGLSITGLDALASWGCRLVITCDNGSTNLPEILYAGSLGIDVIVTDHHTLASDRPPVTAIINPRSLPADHPLANLSGVAVAYKLIEALYETLPELPQQPLENLLDLVAIGLIADLVKLTGDCRYLAQRGIEQLQKNRGQQAPRPGIAKLLELCRKSGDRPTDVSFGLGPRINAISRIQGDARFCVELLTSSDPARCNQLAIETELANARRKVLQRDVMRQAQAKLAQLDLSTTSVIVLADAQWSVGILGLVAGQIAQEQGRPTLILSLEEAEDSPNSTPLARGSARSVNQIDLYQLVQAQAHLLHSFGGHPFAAGLSLPVENIPLLTEALNRQLRQQQSGGAAPGAIVSADLTVEVADLCQDAGKALFSELRLLEPCGMGNPVPRLLIQNCWFTKTWHKKIKAAGDQDGYIKTEFELCDTSSDRSFPGIWWGHYKDELPTGRCDAIVELDFNSYEDHKRKMHFEIRLIAVRPCQPAFGSQYLSDWILDWRDRKLPLEPALESQPVLEITACPSSWTELQTWMQQALQTQRKLAIAYPPPQNEPPLEIWQHLIGLAKHLSRTGKTATQTQLCEKLGIGDRVLQIGLQSLTQIGFSVRCSEANVAVEGWSPDNSEPIEGWAEAQFIAAVQEEQFYRRYFHQMPLEALQAVVSQWLGVENFGGAIA
jgi:single-stranded-DNA-specific exonuclease